MKPNRSTTKVMILDFYYRNWIFSLLILLDILLCSFGLLSSTTIGPSISTTQPSSVCSQLTDNFRFDFALNQHIPMSTTSGRGTNHDYHHYLVSKHHFMRFRIPNDRVVVSMQPVAAQETLDTIPYDIGFSLWAWPVKEAATRLCFLKYLTSKLTCMNLDHYNRRNLDQIESFDPDIKHYKFSLPASYYPTVAYQDVRFTDDAKWLYMVTFLEQELVMKPNRSNYYFERRYRSYMFENMDRIVDLSQGHVIPPYLEQVPLRYEITGVFNWRKNTDERKHEYLILAFNGTNHLYCLNEDCSRADGYKPYLVECRPSFEIDPERSKPVQAIDHHARLDELATHGGDEEQSSMDFLNADTIRKHNYSIYLLSGMVFLMCCLGLLMVGVCYYSVKEVRLQEKKVKKVYEKSILLSQISAKVSQMGGQGQDDDEDDNASPSSPTPSLRSDPDHLRLQSVISSNESTTRSACSSISDSSTVSSASSPTFKSERSTESSKVTHSSPSSQASLSHNKPEIIV